LDDPHHGTCWRIAHNKADAAADRSRAARAARAARAVRATHVELVAPAKLPGLPKPRIRLAD
ncbi:MAG TPA: hypothetical protein VGC41_10665, partial [Kofleriaceae bacterium]